MESGEKTAQTTGKWMPRWVIGLLVCAAVGVVLWVYFLTDENEDGNRTAQEKIREPNAVTAEPNVDANSRISTVDSQDNPEGGRTGENREEGETAGFSSPIEQTSVLKEYSGDQLLYSKTLDQFETHSGIDFTADMDTPVRASASGTVVFAGPDEKYGMTVEVNHGNGYVTRYCNLEEEVTIEEGDVIQKGDVIGAVGETALFETEDAPHLHFEVLKDGVPIDPQSVLR